MKSIVRSTLIFWERDSKPIVLGLPQCELPIFFFNKQEVRRCLNIVLKSFRQISPQEDQQESPYTCTVVPISVDDASSVQLTKLQLAELQKENPDGRLQEANLLWQDRTNPLPDLSSVARVENRKRRRSLEENDREPSLRNPSWDFHKINGSGVVFLTCWCCSQK